MSTNQDYGGREHSSSGTTLKTDIHGKVTGYISISEPEAVVKFAPVKTGGSTYPVAWSEADGDLPELELKVRRTYLKTWEDAIRTAKGFSATDRIEIAGVVLLFTLVSEAFSDLGAPLPTRTRVFSAKYRGHKAGSDRKSADPLEAVIMLQQTSPAEEK